MQVETRKKWEQAMKQEIHSLVQNQTWDLHQFPVGEGSLQNKQDYRVEEEDGGKNRYKDRLVVNGFAQKKDIYFDEISSPIFKMN